MSRALLLLVLVACSAVDPTQASGAIGKTTPSTSQPAPTQASIPAARVVRPGVEVPSGAQAPLDRVDHTNLQPSKLIGEKGSRGLVGEKG